MGESTADCPPRTGVVASGHVSEPVARESTRRRLSAKQADTVDRLGRSAVEVLSRQGFAGLTIRMVAANAGVGAATAYTYFSSKEHLVAEVFWRRLATTPAPPNDSPDPVERVVGVLRHIALLVADDAELAGAVTSALLGKDPDVEQLRVKVGREINKRLTAALGSMLTLAGDRRSARTVSRDVQRRWRAFSRTGVPGGDWPRYDTVDRPVLVFDKRSRVELDPHAERRAVWADFSMGNLAQQ